MPGNQQLIEKISLTADSADNSNVITQGIQGEHTLFEQTWIRGKKLYFLREIRSPMSMGNRYCIRMGFAGNDLIRSLSEIICDNCSSMNSISIFLLRHMYKYR